MDSENYRLTMARFPRTFSIENAGGIFNPNQVLVDINTRPLHYITHRSPLWSGGAPDLTLHSGPDKKSYALAIAKFHFFRASIDITLLVDRHFVLINLRHRPGLFTQSSFFLFAFPNGTTSYFEWKNSQCAEVAALGRRRRGLKLVRMGTKEALAVYSGTGWRVHGRGDFAFTSTESLGPEFELMAVVSLLAVVEKMRRQRRRANHNAGGAAMCVGMAGGFAAGAYR